MKILVKFPTRSRPLRFFNSLKSLYDLAYNMDDIYILVSADHDDKSMYNQEVMDGLAGFSNLTIVYGESRSKIDAVNRDINGLPEIWADAADWDVIVVMSDDMLMTISGWDEIIRMEVLQGGLDALYHFPDQDARHLLAVMYIAGRQFYDRFGYVYNPAFKSLWCDNLVMDIAILLKKYRYVDCKGLFVHLNPAYGHLERDLLFDEQQEMWGEDENMYRLIKARGYDLKDIKTD